MCAHHSKNGWCKRNKTKKGFTLNRDNLLSAVAGLKVGLARQEPGERPRQARGQRPPISALSPHLPEKLRESGWGLRNPPNVLSNIPWAFSMGQPPAWSGILPRTTVEGADAVSPERVAIPSGSMLVELAPLRKSHPTRVCTRGSCGAFKSLGCLPGVLSKSLNLECSAGHGQCLWKASHRHGLYTNRERRGGEGWPSAFRPLTGSSPLDWQQDWPSTRKGRAWHGKQASRKRRAKPRTPAPSTPRPTPILKRGPHFSRGEVYSPGSSREPGMDLHVEDRDRNRPCWQASRSLSGGSL